MCVSERRKTGKEGNKMKENAVESIFSYYCTYGELEKRSGDFATLG